MLFAELLARFFCWDLTTSNTGFCWALKHDMTPVYLLNWETSTPHHPRSLFHNSEERLKDIQRHVNISTANRSVNLACSVPIFMSPQI